MHYAKKAHEALYLNVFPILSNGYLLMFKVDVSFSVLWL